MQRLRTLRRPFSLAILAFEFLALLAPALRANTAYPSGTSRSEYLSDVQSRVSLKNDLEDRWRQARYRRTQIERAISEIRGETPPQGSNLGEYYEERSARIRWLDQYMQRNEETMTRYQASLGSVYDKLEGDKRYLETTEDQQLRQALGTLIGVAGVAGIPIAARPMLTGGATASASGAGARASVVSRGTVRGGGQLSTRVPTPPRGAQAAPPRGSTAAPAPSTAPRPSSSAASAAGNGSSQGAAQTPRRGLFGRRSAAPTPTQNAAPPRATTAPTNAPRTGGNAAAPPRTPSSGPAGSPRASAPAVENGWRTDISKKGNILLRRGDRVIDTGDKAALRDGKGRKAEMVRNEAAWTRAEGLRTMYSTQDQLQRSIRQLRSDLKSAPNRQAKSSIQQEIKNLQAQEKSLNRDIKTAERGGSEGRGSTIKGLVGSAAKWAMFSTALTVGMRAFDQLRENNWDVTSIDWKDAVAPLRTAEFWGGTAGSFGLSMLASAVIPGGTFFKTLAAVGGAAVGWQVGSGNLRHTDWAELGASTLGATIGSILGSALGPVGTFLGGLAGHFVATWALGKLREYLEQGATSTGRDEAQVLDEEGESYVGSADPRAPPDSTASGRSASEIKAEMDASYREIENLMSDTSGDPSIRRRIAELHQQYDADHKELSRLREGSDYVSLATDLGEWSSP